METTTNALALSGFLNALNLLNKIPPSRLAALNCASELIRAEQVLRAIRKDVEERS